jgi:hypothetical protein
VFNSCRDPKENTHPRGSQFEERDLESPFTPQTDKERYAIAEYAAIGYHDEAWSSDS